MDELEKLREKLGLFFPLPNNEEIGDPRLREQALKSGLFELVQKLATESGKQESFGRVPYSLGMTYKSQPHILRKDGMNVYFECRKIFDDRICVEYAPQFRAYVTINGKEVFHAFKSKGRGQVVTAYEPGEWEEKLRGFYGGADKAADAAQARAVIDAKLKAAREARSDYIRQMIKRLNPRNASIW